MVFGIKIKGSSPFIPKDLSLGSITVIIIVCKTNDVGSNPILGYFFFLGSSVEEQRFEKPLVGGSIPSLGNFEFLNPFV